jgi:ribosomal protein S18 acetylase RimI-like enzyme
MLTDTCGGRLHPSLLRLLAAAPPEPVTPTFVLNAHVITRVTYGDIPRVGEIEMAAFGIDGWSSHMLKSLVKPSSNEFLDVIWGYPPPVKVDAPVAQDTEWSSLFIRPIIMGYVGYRLKPNKIPWSFSGSTSKHCNIVSIAVHPDHRGLGMGEALVRHVLSTAEMRCCTHVKLHVREDNIAAQNLYLKTGFAVYDRVPGYYDGLPSLEGSGHSVDALVMQIALPATPVSAPMSDD